MKLLLCLGVLASISGCSSDGGDSLDGGSSGGDSSGGAASSADGGSPPSGTGASTPSGGGGSPASTGGQDSTGGATGGQAGTNEPTLPPGNASFDYQIGGPYAPPPGVDIVSRDRSASPASGLYNLCYVNGFQTQPGESEFWLTEHPDLILRDEQGDVVIDPDWNEMLFDTTTAEKRASLAGIVGEWIKGCAEDGFDAVEIDNLDTYSRSGNRITQEDNVAFMRLLSDVGHAHGLAMGQKNSAEILSQATQMGTDFAVAEECNRYKECGDYVDVYGDLVFVIEYRDQDFKFGCENFPQLSIVRRDVEVSTPNENGYVYEGC